VRGLAKLTEVDESGLWHRQFLNPYALFDDLRFWRFYVARFVTNVSLLISFSSTNEGMTSATSWLRQ
jgi:hypothetical protein